jgi:hypothetical protein
MRTTSHAALPLVIALLGTLLVGGARAADAHAVTKPAAGPLRIHPINPRYFADGTQAADGSLRAVYLAGSHHWNNLQDTRVPDRPASDFDYAAYLRFLRSHDHNFMRMWAWEGGANKNRYEPLAYVRTDNGKYDLSHFNQAYFHRLRSRVAAAGKEGIYVSVMLFQG